jgi:hypothetical protein
MRTTLPQILLALLLSASSLHAGEALPFPVPDTGQVRCYGPRGEIAPPGEGEPYFGQDAQYRTRPPAYRDNGDGTVTDLVTGLVWQKTPSTGTRDQDDAERYAKRLRLAGHDDWRLPTITELFSIADFRGNQHTSTPYVDTRYFDFHWPDSDVGEEGRPGERRMDAQYASATRYLGVTMGRDRSAFGFNVADGRIKSYPLHATRYVRCVRGNPRYGVNRFRDNGDGTVTDAATGLTWQQGDSGEAMDWPAALRYAEALELAGRSDWRLPDVKELQSIVDYTRAPDADDPRRRGPAIDPVFELTDPAAWYWSGTTHIETGGAYYVAFGKATAMIRQRGGKVDAHGAGAVRSDPKTGDPGRWPDGLGPQRDEVRIRNGVRAVRGGVAGLVTEEPPVEAGEPGRNSGEGRGPGPWTPAPSPAARFIQRLDADGDGRVSRAEFDGPRHAFSRHDTDGDGYISGMEAPEGPPPRR